MDRRVVRLCLVVTAFAGCDLNPQPGLPASGNDSRDFPTSAAGGTSANPADNTGGSTGMSGQLPGAGLGGGGGSGMVPPIEKGNGGEGGDSGALAGAGGETSGGETSGGAGGQGGAP
jgi:hypothetical protein